MKWSQSAVTLFSERMQESRMEAAMLERGKLSGKQETRAKDQ